MEADDEALAAEIATEDERAAFLNQRARSLGQELLERETHIQKLQQSLSLVTAASRAQDGAEESSSGHIPSLVPATTLAAFDAQIASTLRTYTMRRTAVREPDVGRVSSVVITSGEHRCSFNVPADCTFGQLKHEVARLWNVVGERTDFHLTTHNGAVWSTQDLVSERLSALDVAPELHLVRIVPPQFEALKALDPSATLEDTNDGSKSTDSIRLWKDRRRKEEKYEMKQLVFFAIYAFVFILLIGLRRDIPNFFWFQDTLKEATTRQGFGKRNNMTLTSIVNADDFWEYLGASTLDPGRNSPLPRFMFDSTAPHTRSKNPFFGKTAAIATAVRFHQFRTQSGCGCEVSTATGISDYFTACYVPYTDLCADRDTYGRGATYAADGFTFSYPSERQQILTGRHGSYGASGFIIDIGGAPLATDAVTWDRWVQVIDDLYKYDWIDEKSAAVVITMNVYNANVDMLCSVRLLFEVNRAGAFEASTRSLCDEARKYQAPLQIVCLVLNFLVALLTLGFVYRWAWMCKSYFDFAQPKIWDPPFPIYFFYFVDNWFEASIVPLVIAASSMRLYGFFYHSIKQIAFDSETPPYQEWFDVLYWENTAYILDGITTLVILARLMSYLKLIAQIRAIFDGIQAGLTEQAGFTLFILPIFAAYIFVAHEAFGLRSNNYCYLSDSITSLLLIFVGDATRSVGKSSSAFVSWLVTFFLYMFILLFFLIVLDIYFVIMFQNMNQKLDLMDSKDSTEAVIDDFNPTTFFRNVVSKTTKDPAPAMFESVSDLPYQKDANTERLRKEEESREREEDDTK
tara:strand:- start:29 stop:2434 length:2406 start_codon:yes stop_codon:yes gene_type:complete